MAELRAVEVGVGADRALIASDLISEDAYLAALTASLGLPFEPLNDIPRAACPLSNDQLIEVAPLGILPLIIAETLYFVVAPRAMAARWLVETMQPDSDLAQRIRITTTERLHHFIACHNAQEIAHRAAEALRTARPDLSAGAARLRPATALSVLAASTLALLMAPGPVMTIFNVALGFVFFAWAALRLLGTLTAPLTLHRSKTFSDERLPVYTIIVALYREAAAVTDLVAALRRLNYPKEKLNIIFVLEEDDSATRRKLEEMRLTAPFELIIAPAVAPRTKPKALNAALPFARGTFIVVYDAEDRPEPNQLRRALEAFAADDDRLACAQARLTIDNTTDSWLARFFTAEYAGLFDVFLPSLAAWQLPLPLGGSSNHFRADVLRRIGAWDPYNVTEDADLGMRLARFGYHTTVISSTTYEEAPARLRPWLKQRTRWFKGWMQTWLVHMRAPHQLLRALGPASFAVFQLVVGGTVLAALIHPLFVIQLLWGIIPADSVEISQFSIGFHVIALTTGYFVSAILALTGLARRRLLDCAWVLLLTPLYWFLLSLAAWRAFYQLVRDPYRWEKTEHGLARSSRLTEEANTGAANG